MRRLKRIPVKRPRLPKAYLHYSTFDALCKRAAESSAGSSDILRSVVFSASLRRMFVARSWGPWPGDLYDVDDLGLGTPFSPSGELVEGIKATLDEDYFETGSREKKYISSCRDRFLCEIVIVGDDEEEDISAVVL